MSARVRRPGAIQVHGVTTSHDVIWQIGNGPTRETKAADVLDFRSAIRYYSSGLANLFGEFVNESDLNAMTDALKARNRGEGHPLCLSCHRQSVVLGLDVCSGCNDGAELRPDMDADRFLLGDAIDDDASHAEEQRRHAATRWAEAE